MKYKIRTNKGFTIIEVLLVLSMLFILISIFSLRINGLILYFKLKIELNELYSQFLKARQLSIINQDVYGLSFNNSENSYTLFSEKKGKIDTKKMNSGVTYFDINFRRGNIMTFKPTGTAESGHIIIGNRTGKKYKIIIYGLTGRVRYSDYET